MLYCSKKRFVLVLKMCLSKICIEFYSEHALMLIYHNVTILFEYFVLI